MESKTIQIFEYSILSKVKSDQGNTAYVSPSDFLSLEKMKDSLPKGMMEFQGSDAVLFKQFVGNIFLPSGTCIEILPKVNREQHSDKANVCRHTLLYMLSKVFKLKISASTAGNSALAKFPLQDIFIQYFCELLEEQLHKGYLRTYVTEEDNLSTLRGRLIFKDHIRLNAVNKARFYCEFDEFTEDNLFNRQLKAAIRVFRGRVSNQQTYRHLTDLAFAFSDVRDMPVDINTIERLHFTRLNDRFKTVFDMAILILAGKSPNMSTGEHSAPAMLFDMNKLFEEFVALELKKKLSREYSLSAQFNEINLSKKHSFKLKPDIVVTKSEVIESILDTKWKAKGNKDSVNVSQADAYQMYAYGHRMPCDKLALIYPDFTKDKTDTYELMKNHTGSEFLTLKVFQVSLDIFDEDNKVMQKNDRFEKSLDNIVKFISA